MPKYMHNTFWLEDQISVTFKISTPAGLKLTLASIIGDLRQRIDALNNLLLENSASNDAFKGVSLSFFDQKDMDTQLPSSEMDMPPCVPTRGSNDFPGLYLFTPGIIPPTRGSTEARVVSFLSLKKPTSTPPALAASPSEMPGMPEGGPTPDGGFHAKERSPEGLIPQIVNLINGNIDSKGKQQITPGSNSQVSVSSAAPTYLCGSTSNPHPLGHIGEGCPLSPPIPVAAGDSCSSSPGLWPISLPELPADLQPMTGDGVTVFVLDTLPQLEQIQKAAAAAGDNNLLLQDVAKNVTFSYPAIPAELDQPGPLQVGTGKDIHGRVVGFKMPDHGMFVAGIIHDLAPKAKIECIRVLNDLCTGSVQTITDALSGIHQRM
ncbi:MAG: hypothetical protein ACJ8BW_04215, partial [Ktedonobacteraceae bacterium]